MKTNVLNSNAKSSTPDLKQQIREKISYAKGWLKGQDYCLVMSKSTQAERDSLTRAFEYSDGVCGFLDQLLETIEAGQFDSEYWEVIRRWDPFNDGVPDIHFGCMGLAELLMEFLEQNPSKDVRSRGDDDREAARASPASSSDIPAESDQDIDPAIMNL